MNARTQIFTQNQCILAQLTDNDIISYKLSSYQIVGDNMFEYNIIPYEFTVLYSKLKNTLVLDQYYLPISLDQHNILNSCLVYYINQIDDVVINRQCLYILQDSIQYSDQQNTFFFKAVPMIGVIAKYNAQNPVVLVNQQEIQVPAPIRFTSSYTGSGYEYYSPIWTNIANTIDGRVNQIYGTIVANIFTNNRKDYSADLWYHTDYHQQYWIDTSKAKNAMKITDIGYDTVFQSTPMYIHVLGQNNFLSWDQEILNRLQIPTFDINAYIFQNETTSLSRRFSNYFNFILGKVGYGERVGIDYIPDPMGYTADQLISQLTGYGFYTYSAGIQPYILTGSTDPGDIDIGQHVIGYYPDRPTWLNTSSTYHYRNYANNGVLRKLKLQFWKYGIRYYDITPDQSGNFYDYKVKAVIRRLSYDINPMFPNAFGYMYDTGYNEFYDTAKTIYTGGYPTLFHSPAQNFIYPQQLPYNYSGSWQDLTNDDFVKFYQDTPRQFIKQSITFYTNSITSSLSYRNDPLVDNGRLSDYFYVNSPLTLQGLRFQTDTNLNMINILNAFLLYQNMSIIQQDGGSYDTAKKCCYTRRIYNDNIWTVPQSQFYNLDNYISQIASYKFIPYMPIDLRTLDTKYSQIIQSPAFISSLKHYYNLLRHNYKRKIIIVINNITIGTHINTSTDRYFIFKGRRYICTSYTVDTLNNTTTIQGMGN